MNITYSLCFPKFSLIWPVTSVINTFSESINIVLSLSNYYRILSITDLHKYGQKEKNGDVFRVSLRCITYAISTKDMERSAMLSSCLDLSRRDHVSTLILAPGSMTQRARTRLACFPPFPFGLSANLRFERERRKEQTQGGSPSPRTLSIATRPASTVPISIILVREERGLLLGCVFGC